ncbi:CinA family protein, partial [Nanoarchaeota archaeon]
LILDINSKMNKSKLKDNGKYNNLLQKAKEDLKQWAEKSGREQNYTAEDLTDARIFKEEANKYQTENLSGLSFLNAMHQAIINYNMIETGLNEILIEEGKEGRKFGIVELSSRLTPVLTFPSSSNYFEVSIIPYGKKSREVIGEKPNKKFLSEEVAEESAENLIRNFGVHYALAETSAAPREDVPKSARKPEIYLTSIYGDKKETDHYIIDTPFRHEFDSQVREIMYRHLGIMYIDADPKFR